MQYCTSCSVWIDITTICRGVSPRSLEHHAVCTSILTWVKFLCKSQIIILELPSKVLQYEQGHRVVPMLQCMFLCVVVFFPVVRVVVHKVHANINGAKQNHSAAACGAPRHSRMSSGALPHKLLLVAVLTKPLVMLELCLSLRKIAVVATAAGVIIILRHAKA